MNLDQIFLGKRSTLSIINQTKHGVYLGSEDYPELKVLLPSNQTPENARTGDKLDVFLYKDSEDRLIATTTESYITLGQTALLRVTDVTPIGAFPDWGLQKDLLLPFKEQTKRVRANDELLAALYIDKSSRLCATMHVYDYLSCDSPYQKGDHVQGLVYDILDAFGVFVAVDNRYSALIPHNEMTRELAVGEQIEARIKDVTKEGKLTLSLQEKVKIQIEVDAERIYKRLEDAGGFLPFHDKTSPEIIKREFQMSKAAFKRAVGKLMKKKKITLSEKGIERI